LQAPRTVQAQRIRTQRISRQHLLRRPWHVKPSGTVARGTTATPGFRQRPVAAVGRHPLHSDGLRHRPRPAPASGWVHTALGAPATGLGPVAAFGSRDQPRPGPGTSHPAADGAGGGIPGNRRLNETTAYAETTAHARETPPNHGGSRWPEWHGSNRDTPGKKAGTWQPAHGPGRGTQGDGPG